MGKACVIIPSPYVPDQHQLRNASVMADHRAALMVEEKDFSGGALPLAVNALLDDADLRQSLESNIRAFAGEDANRLIYEHILAAVAQSKSKKTK